MTALTDTAAELLLAIRTNPADDTARLAFADWLEEEERIEECDRCGGKPDRGVGPRTGHPNVCHKCRGSGRVPTGVGERAEFIRVQCRLAESQYGGIPKEEFAALRARERELFKDSGPRFWNDLPGAFRSTTVRMTTETSDGIIYKHERGWVSSITIPAAAYTEDLARKVFASQPVTRVVLSDRVPSRDLNSESWDWWDEAHQPDRIEGRFLDILKERAPIVCPPIWRRGSRYIECPSEPLAQLALSDAAVTWGRRLAGLPDLPLPAELEAAR